MKADKKEELKAKIKAANKKEEKEDSSTDQNDSQDKKKAGSKGSKVAVGPKVADKKKPAEPAKEQEGRPKRAAAQAASKNMKDPSRVEGSNEEKIPLKKTPQKGSDKKAK